MDLSSSTRCLPACSSGAGRPAPPSRLAAPLQRRAAVSMPQKHQHAQSLRPSRARGVNRRSGRSSLTTRVEAETVAAPGVTRVGFIGLGIMGQAMVANLLKAGYQVTVWNRSPDKCEGLRAAGAQVGASPRDVASQSDITLAMLADPAAALDVATGADGVAAGIGAGRGYVDVSTVDADTSRRVAAAIRATGACYLEAPVSGSKGPAEQGQLIFLAAGDAALYERAAPLLDVMGKARFFLGEVSAGANMKLVVNMVMGTMMASFAEGLSLAQRAGLKQEDVVEVIKLGAIAAPMFALKGPAMTGRSYPTAFPLKHQQKDLRLALLLGDEVGQALPTAAAANELYIAARARGQADADFSAVLDAVLPPLPEQQ